jgi:hypothetical protein
MCYERRRAEACVDESAHHMSLKCRVREHKLFPRTSSDEGIPRWFAEVEADGIREPYMRTA